MISTEALAPTPGERDRVFKLAKEMGVVVPGNSSAIFWMLPILEELWIRVQSLERYRRLQVERDNGL